MQALFYILFFFTPLVLWPYTSELFEFNKMVFVYLTTTLIMAVWIWRCIIAKKLIFRRTLLDIPLVIFLGSQILSTLFSIDQRTSVLGYYSRFNGGLLSSISYSLLYWAFVSNMTKERVIKCISFLLGSSIVVSLIAVLEHFGINITCGLMGQGLSSCWIQDVQNRVFSTLGQPNWLATWIVALIPLTLYQILDSQNIKKILFYLLSILLFATILFTKSRSALLGFIASDFIFWIYAFILKRKKVIVPLIISNLFFIFLFLIISTPWNPAKIMSLEKIQGPALETGGTESGTIRKIVWKGALKIWFHYPILGSGPETFAFSYYQFRPVEHNLVSEWDFLYNKAHNEYLNLAATSGTLGILSYLYLIVMMFLVFLKKPDLFSISLAAGFSGILMANFFGFSTVSTQLQFFLFPVLAITQSAGGQQTENSQKKKPNNHQKVLGIITLLTITYLLYTICKYWYADTLFAKGDVFSLQKAIQLSPKEAVFHNKLAELNLSVSESEKAIQLSPANINLLRSQAGIYLKLAASDPKYLGSAKNTLLGAIVKAPTDAKLWYNLALIYTRTGETDLALKTIEKTIQMKSNYKNARYLYALILTDKGNLSEAKNQLNYILEKIDPKDINSQNLLKKI